METDMVYTVGDYYNDGVREGVVFAVSADGCHGKIVSMRHSAEPLQWSSDSAEQKCYIGADGDNDGAANMAKVMAISNWQSKYPAFKWCADLGTGWYLPSKVELSAICGIRDMLNLKLTDSLARAYWSSTEADCKWSSDDFCAWFVYMGSGYTVYCSKGDRSYVRAVSVF